MDALFTAFDISTLSTNVSTVLTVGVGLMLLFLGYRYLKRGSRII